MQIEKDRAKAQKQMLSKNQIQILGYLAEKGPAILEQTYKELKMQKPTCGYHMQQLENFGLIAVRGGPGKAKPRGLTELGEDVVKLLKGETISDEHRIELITLDSIVRLGLKNLTKTEIRRAIELFSAYIEEDKVPSAADLRVMVS